LRAYVELKNMMSRHGDGFFADSKKKKRIEEKMRRSEMGHTRGDKATHDIN